MPLSGVTLEDDVCTFTSGKMQNFVKVRVEFHHWIEQQ